MKLEIETIVQGTKLSKFFYRINGVGKYNIIFFSLGKEGV